MCTRGMHQQVGRDPLAPIELRLVRPDLVLKISSLLDGNIGRYVHNTADYVLGFYGFRTLLVDFVHGERSSRSMGYNSV